MELTKDQRNNTGMVLTEQYLRKWNDRHNFSVIELGHNADEIPFEMFCYWRHFYNEDFKGMTY